MQDKFSLMKEIRDEVIGLKESPLYLYRTQNNYLPVIGEGNHDSKVVFIGEAPGLQEAKTGRPFCGRSGKFLTFLIESIGMKREDVYITNVVKDRPQDNRDPLPEEIDLYGGFLVRQLEIVQPKVICMLGRHSMRFIFNHFNMADSVTTIGDMHGTAYATQSNWGDIILFPLYHPAVALYNPNMRSVLVEDMLKIKNYLK